MGIYLNPGNENFRMATVADISLAYITGNLPVVRDKIQSKLNNFREYTFINSLNLTEFIGFTSDEVKNCVLSMMWILKSVRHGMMAINSVMLKIIIPNQS